MATSPALAKSAPSPVKSAPPAAAAPAKKRSKLLKPLLGALLVSAAAAGAWFGGLRHHPAMAFEPKPASSAAKKNSPTFLPLEPFTVNLLDTDRERYLQLGIVIELNDPRMLDAVKQKMPIIRSQILMQLANKRMADLLGMEAKERLARDIVARMRLPVESEAADKGVEKVHFSQFIIQ